MITFLKRAAQDRNKNKDRVQDRSIRLTLKNSKLRINNMKKKEGILSIMNSEFHLTTMRCRLTLKLINHHRPSL